MDFIEGSSELTIAIVDKLCKGPVLSILAKGIELTIHSLVYVTENLYNIVKEYLDDDTVDQLKIFINMDIYSEDDFDDVYLFEVEKKLEICRTSVDKSKLTVRELEFIYAHWDIGDENNRFDLLFEEYIPKVVSEEIKNSFGTTYAYYKDIYEMYQEANDKSFGAKVERFFKETLPEAYNDYLDFNMGIGERTYDFIQKSKSVVKDFFDYLLGKEENHNVEGTSGDDHMLGDNNDNEMFGYGGDDYIHGGGGNDVIWGGAGNDHLFGEDYMDTIYGESGNDYINGGSGSDELHGGPGDDRIFGMDGLDTIYGGSGDDYIDGGKNSDTIFGNGGKDTIIGGDGRDEIHGGSGNDIIYGNDDDDLIFGDSGTDIIDGGDGDDVIYGGEDRFGIGDNDNMIYGGDGKDTIYGGAGNDLISGDDDNDIIYGGDGFDTICGGYCDDRLEGEEGHDELYGEFGNDRLYGQSGCDELYGGFGDDYLYGGSDRDVLDGGYDNDFLYGNEGNDAYIYKPGYGHDTIYDNNGNSTIKFINIDMSEITFAAAENKNDLVFTVYDADNTLTIQRYDLTSELFTFEFSDADDYYYTLEGDFENGTLAFKQHEQSKFRGYYSTNSGLHVSLPDDMKNNGSYVNNKKYEEATIVTPPRDPLIIDFDGDGIETVGFDKEIYFDLDNNGFAEKTAWVGPNDGFLVLDRNGDGRITNGTELFSDQIYLSNGQKSESGFETLAEFDSNGDKKIDKKDAVFSDLRVWIDKNQNGISETNATDGKKKELYTLEELGIESISLKFVEPEEEEIVTENGVTRTAYSDVTFADKKTSHIIENWFEVNTADTQEINPNSLDDGRTSFGNMPSLGKALETDTTGTLEKLVTRFKTSERYIEKRVITREILYFITGATEISKDSRGGSVDARNLHVLEKVMGVEYFIGADGGKNPNPNAVSILNSLYLDFEELYYNLINFTSGFTSYMELVDRIPDENGEIVLDYSAVLDRIDHTVSIGHNADEMICTLAAFLHTYDKNFGTKHNRDSEGSIPCKGS